MKYPLLVDGRNLYDPAEMVAKGFFYQAIGRPTVEPISEVRCPPLSPSHCSKPSKNLHLLPELTSPPPTRREDGGGGRTA